MKCLQKNSSQTCHTSTIKSYSIWLFHQSTLIKNCVFNIFKFVRSSKSSFNKSLHDHVAKYFSNYRYLKGDEMERKIYWAYPQYLHWKHASSKLLNIYYCDILLHRCFCFAKSFPLTHVRQHFLSSIPYLLRKAKRVPINHSLRTILGLERFICWAIL